MNERDKIFLSKVNPPCFPSRSFMNLIVHDHLKGHKRISLRIKGVQPLKGVQNISLKFLRYKRYHWNLGGFTLLSNILSRSFIKGVFYLWKIRSIYCRYWGVGNRVCGVYRYWGSIKGVSNKNKEYIVKISIFKLEICIARGAQQKDFCK